MKRTLNILSFVLVVLTSCESIKKTVRESYEYELYIDYKNVSYQGQNTTQRLYFEIDSTRNMWFYGKLILDSKDTIRIHGFEKGSHYVATYKKRNPESNGRLEIWSRGETGLIRDSLSIEDVDKTTGIVQQKTILYRRPRKNCP